MHGQSKFNREHKTNDLEMITEKRLKGQENQKTRNHESNVTKRVRQIKTRQKQTE